jgi:hypothetical protein
VDAIQNLIIGVIGSLIATLIVAAWNAGFNSLPKVKRRPLEGIVDDEGGDHRARNRERFKLAVLNMSFFFYTFFLLYEAISLPPILRVMMSGNEMLLSDARFIGGWLPEISITRDMAQVGLLIVVAALYPLLLGLVAFIVRSVEPLIDRFLAMTIILRRRIQVVVFALFAGAIAISSTWLFYPITLKEAAIDFSGVMLIALLFMASGKR